MAAEQLRPGERCVHLRHGWRDAKGALHTVCILRPARVFDEIRALGDFRVFLRAESLRRVLLSRVVVRIGSEERVDVGLIEALNPDDVRLLEESYCDMNGYGEAADQAVASDAPRSGGDRPS